MPIRPTSLAILAALAGASPPVGVFMVEPAERGRPLEPAREVRRRNLPLPGGRPV